MSETGLNPVSLNTDLHLNESLRHTNKESWLMGDKIKRYINEYLFSEAFYTENEQRKGSRRKT